MTRSSLLLLATTALIPAVSSAQQVIQLDEIIISGGLSPIPEDGFTRAHTVLTETEIQSRGISTIQDALRAVPGVSVSGAGSSYTQVRIRGAEADHTLVLIDGIEASGGDDEYVFSGIETANVERIEVLRGPQSVFYGSNASAGVINIISKSGGQGLSYGGAVEFGNGASGSARVSHYGASGGLSLNLSARDDHGIDQSGDGGEKDRITRKSIGISGVWNATETLRFGTTLHRSDESNDYDATNFSPTDADSYIVDDPNQHADKNELQASVWGEHTMLDGRLVQRFEYQDSVFKRSDNGGPVTRGETEKFKYRLSYGLDGQTVAESNHLLNILAERQEDDSTAAPDYSRKMNSFAAEYRGFLDNGLDIQAGIRRDDNRTFEDFTSWNLGLSWRMADRPVRFHASAGSALVNPSFYELFANDPYTRGNQNLKPEINRGYDLGVEVAFMDGRGLVDLTYFNEKLEDEITYTFGSEPDGRSGYVNQNGKSPREGVEFTGRIQATEDLHLAMNYTYVDAKDPNGKVETRRPRHELGLSATMAFLNGRGAVTADIRHVAGNYNDEYWGNFATTKLPDYTTLNLAANYELTDNVRLTGRIVNVTDRNYSEVLGYATPGRTAYLGLQAAW